MSSNQASSIKHETVRQSSIRLFRRTYAYNHHNRPLEREERVRESVRERDSTRLLSISERAEARVPSTAATAGGLAGTGTHAAYVWMVVCITQNF